MRALDEKRARDPKEKKGVLGGNIGDRKANLEAAISRLAATPGVTLAAQSSFIGTEPWGKTDQEWFLNAAVAIDTSLSARQLLEVCLGIETAMGRVREEKWGPRIIDLDVLTYGNETIYEDGLQVPHPYIAEREFVLEPLAEIAPDLIIDGKTVKEHLAAHTG